MTLSVSEHLYTLIILQVSEKFILANKANGQPSNEEFMLQVVDEIGNPMKYTLQDGTQLEVGKI